MKGKSPIVGILKTEDQIDSSDIQIGLIANAKKGLNK
jgi:hypothetical protein